MTRERDGDPGDREWTERSIAWGGEDQGDQRVTENVWTDETKNRPMVGVRGACLTVGSGMSERMGECRGGSVKSPEVRGLARYIVSKLRSMKNSGDKSG